MDTTAAARTHSFVVSGSRFVVDSKFEFIKAIGHGAYGVVISCRDTETGNKVAIKKIPRAFDDIVDAKRILREIKLLQHLQHENVMGIIDILRPRSFETFEDVYIVSELMETDLHRIIYSRQDLTDDHVQYFIYQVLRAVKYMHSANVLHRDLKPSNLLLNSNCDLKVCDFGLARGIDDRTQQDLTEYVVTRWYRAPEIMLSEDDYTKAVDLWSCGCILAELLGRKPIFPGEDYIHQLQCIVEILGPPAEEDMDFITSEKAKKFIHSQGHKQKVPWASLFPDANPRALDLLEMLLQYNPAKRFDVEAALRHDYIASLHNADDEPAAETTFLFEHERAELTKPMLVELVYMELCNFHPEAASELPSTSSLAALSRGAAK
jgi:serine/threonine protein kinase